MNASGSGMEEELYAYSLEVVKGEEGISFRPSFSLPFDDPRSVADVYYFIKRAENLLRRVLEIQDALGVYEKEKEFFNTQFKELKGKTPEELISEADTIDDLFENYLGLEPHE